jgi:ferrous iron transport protein A
MNVAMFFRRICLTRKPEWVQWIEIQSQQDLATTPEREPTLDQQSLLPLELLAPGEWADIADVSGEATWVGRLAEMGVRIGCRLRLVQQGNPCLFQVDGARLSLRSEQALQILVRPVTEVG